jgi:hypothetical protein
MPAEAGSAVREVERVMTEENFVIRMNDEG